MSNLLYVCEICGSVLLEDHCKARCPNCGRMLDCSDLAILSSNGKIDEDGEGGQVFIPLPTTHRASVEERTELHKPAPPAP